MFYEIVRNQNFIAKLLDIFMQVFGEYIQPFRCNFERNIVFYVKSFSLLKKVLLFYKNILEVNSTKFKEL